MLSQSSEQERNTLKMEAERSSETSVTLIRLHGIISPQTVAFTVRAVRNSNFTFSIISKYNKIKVNECHRARRYGRAKVGKTLSNSESH
jgi:riboflavin synthase alpha subunit